MDGGTATAVDTQQQVANVRLTVRRTRALTCTEDSGETLEREKKNQNSEEQLGDETMEGRKETARERSCSAVQRSRERTEGVDGGTTPDKSPLD